jgi:hypothetical protein
MCLSWRYPENYHVLGFFESEKQQVTHILNYDVLDGFNSIFTDDVCDGEWNGTKDQTKKKSGG